MSDPRRSGSAKGQAMTAEQMVELESGIDRFLLRFRECFLTLKTYAHLKTYALGLLSAIPRKSVEPIALEAGVPPKTLQQFLTLSDWDHDRFRQILQRAVVADHPSPLAVGVIDDTTFPKQGNKTPGVQRQWCGTLGKVDNCYATVHLAYALPQTSSTSAFAALIDSDLYLPESWAVDRPRCKAAGIPDSMEYSPKWQIALRQLDRAKQNGVRFRHVVADTWYGDIPGFHLGLQQRKQPYVLQVGKDFSAQPISPAKVQTAVEPAIAVGVLVNSHPQMTNQPWLAHNIGDGTKGPRVWEVKRTTIRPKFASQAPTLEFLVARNAINHEEVKYFTSDSSPETATTELLRAAFARWQIEDCFETAKSGLGLGHYEGRTHIGLVRHHLIVMALLFYACQITISEKKSNLWTTVWQTLSAWAGLAVSLLCELEGAALLKFLNKVSAKLFWRQKRNEASQKSATIRQKAKLEAMGIESDAIPSCVPNTS